MAIRLLSNVNYIFVLYPIFYISIFAGCLIGLKLSCFLNQSTIFRLYLLCVVLLMLYAISNSNSVHVHLFLFFFFILRGISEGVYWANYNSVIFQTFPEYTRDKLFLTMQSIGFLCSFIFPVVSGACISFFSSAENTTSNLPAGYQVVFVITLSVFILFFFFSPSIKSKYYERFQFFEIMIKARKAIHTEWYYYITTIGFVGISLSVCSIILTYNILNNEIKYGFFSSITNFLAGSFFLIYSRSKYSEKKRIGRVNEIFIGSLADMASRLIYALAPTMSGLAIKISLDSFLVPFKTTFSENIVRTQVELEAVKLQVSRLGMYLYQEFLLLVARILSCLALCVILFFMARFFSAKDAAVRFFLVISSFSPLLEFLLLNGMIRKERRILL